MTDIIERLRDLRYVLRVDECKKAAYEIEQLRAKNEKLEEAAYDIEILRAKNAQLAWSRYVWKKQACRRQDLRKTELEELLTENEKLKAEVKRLNTVLSDVSYCDTPGENDKHCEREDGDLCPMWGWYDGPICSATGLYIGDDPRNK